MYNRNYLKEKRKKLRNKGTSAESFLWKFLSKSQLKGRKFRRQHSIENYIVDFYCPIEKLIVELDGEVHNNPVAEVHDEKRDDILQDLGYRVLRFENQMVFQHLESVLQEIKDNFKKK